MSNDRIVMSCGCPHDFQDKTYGVGMRLFNPVTKTPGTARCTVCGSVKSVKISDVVHEQNTKQKQKKK